MTTYHLPFPDAGHHLQPHFNSRDSALDIAAAAGMPLPRPRSPFDLYDGLDLFLPTPLSTRHSHPPAHSSFALSDFLHDDPSVPGPSHGPFYNSWAHHSLQPDPHAPIPPHVQHHDAYPPIDPLVLRSSPPPQVFPTEGHVIRPEATRSSFIEHNAGPSSNVFYMPSAPSVFAPSGGHGPWTVTQSSQEQSVPEPQPSWTMSGSLDPTTGIFQRAPEHPRVRTAQACEPCRKRKAKCSGEHPICQRCRNRGLNCEYAPERKMRGPNKVKRKPSVASNAASRRASVISSSSDETSSLSGSSKPSTCSTSQKSSIDGTGSEPVSLPSPTSSHTSSSEFSPHDQASTKRLHKLRPPSLDLKRTSMFELQTQFLNHANAQPRSPVRPAEDDVFSSRRASLPSYLLESYSRTAQDSLGAPTQRPYSTQPYPFGNPNVFDRLKASGNYPMSTPITPINLTVSSPFHRNPTDFLAAPQFATGVDPTEAHIAAVESHYGVPPNDLGNAVAWTDSIMDLDATPTVDENGREKNLTLA